MTETHLRLLDEGSGGIFDPFTLKGFVEQYCAQKARTLAPGREALHTHELYKLYSEESALLGRLRKLPSPLQEQVIKAITEFGGIVPRSLHERVCAENPWDGALWKRELEAKFLGTVREMQLEPFGIHCGEDALILFQELVVAKLRALAVERPAAVHHEVEMGVDLVSDLARFLAFLEEDHVRFTVHGELFKTSEKRLVDQFVPGVDPKSKEPGAHEVLEFIYRFATAERLVHRTGERTYSVSDRGREWESRPLLDKQQDLLRFAVEERGLPGEHFHQVRLRRVCLRFLKRMEAERWHDAMFLPFVARNAYVATLDRSTVEPFLAARHGQAPAAAGNEDLQQMAWNLLSWIRRRLVLLGVVDLGLDAVGRPVAIRLSRLGAKLLGVLPSKSFRAGHSHLVVNPNFEIILLPEGDEFEIVHALDRFCSRRKHEVLYHYELHEESLRRGLRDGLRISEILGWLSRFARTPLPQNVIYSVHEWAERAGVVWLEGQTLRSRFTEAIEKLAHAPRIAPHVDQRPSAEVLVLKSTCPHDEIRLAARDLGLHLDRPA